MLKNIQHQSKMPKGVHDLFFVFKGEQEELFNFNGNLLNKKNEKNNCLILPDYFFCSSFAE